MLSVIGSHWSSTISPGGDSITWLLIPLGMLSVPLCSPLTYCEQEVCLLRRLFKHPPLLAHPAVLFLKRRAPLLVARCREDRRPAVVPAAQRRSARHQPHRGGVF